MTRPPMGRMTREAEPDLKVRLAQAIDGLPDGYRAVFVMHDVEGYTHEEIARLAGRASGNLQSPTVPGPRPAARGTRRLREGMSDVGRPTGRPAAECRPRVQRAAGDAAGGDVGGDRGAERTEKSGEDGTS